MNVIYTVDLWLLQSTMFIRNWFADWLSVRQRALELTLFGLLVLGYIGQSMLGWLVAFCVIWLTLFFLSRIYTPDVKRFFKLMVEIDMRIVFALIPMIDVFRYFSHISWKLDSFVNIMSVILLYLTSIPYSGGQSGKKRKLALAKLKELFGTSWVVDPLPMPH